MVHQWCSHNYYFISSFSKSDESEMQLYRSHPSAWDRFSLLYFGWQCFIISCSNFRPNFIRHTGLDRRHHTVRHPGTICIPQVPQDAEGRERRNQRAIDFASGFLEDPRAVWTDGSAVEGVGCAAAVVFRSLVQGWGVCLVREIRSLLECFEEESLDRDQEWRGSGGHTVSARDSSGARTEVEDGSPGPSVWERARPPSMWSSRQLSEVWGFWLVDGGQVDPSGFSRIRRQFCSDYSQMPHDQDKV